MVKIAKVTMVMEVVDLTTVEDVLMKLMQLL